ncbi:DUF6571 family protein [Streptomyces sp. NPDC020412]|uniref:DUF6571 family protein n=1 Tax=Streptomyces sp. NPDC020412 TaxID=3365073 RepID=UPI0037A5536C
MDLESLRTFTFESLDNAVDDWSKVVTNLEELAESADKGLRVRANKANWAGVNAKVSRQFIGKTAGEFSDAGAQAASIRNILRDTRDELRTFQGQLRAALERSGSKNLTVTATADGGFTVTKVVHPDRAAKGTDPPTGTPEDATALRDEIQAILDKATESDTSAARVLKALVDQTDHGFSGARYADRDSGANALKEADRLAALAKKKPADMSVEDFDAINAGLKRYGSDELFAERFATALGPKGTLDFWAGLNDSQRNMELTSRRAGDLDDLQKHLGLTMATASHSDTLAMTRWKGEMVELAGQPLNRDTHVMGAQVMSNLMRWGDFDDRFLGEYGAELVRTEKKLSDNGSHVPMGWQHMAADPLLNRTGTDSGSDPMTGFLKALANSPGAATDFFGEPFTTDDDGKQELSNFQYLFEERDWPEGPGAGENDAKTGRDYMAEALESALTGHPAGELPTPDTPAHTLQQAALMKSLVESISDEPERFTDHMYMGDSIGQITSEYLPDINRSLRGEGLGNTNQLLPIAGAPADLGPQHSTRFLVTIGQSPEAYAAVEVGQARYTADLMDYHLNPNLPEDRRFPHPPEDTIEAIAHQTGHVNGTLAIGRQEAVTGAAAQEVAAFTDSIDQQKTIWSGAIGTGVGVGVSFIATPVGGAIAGGVASTVGSVVLEGIFKQSETDALQNAGKEAGKLWHASEQNSITHAEAAAKTAAQAHGATYQDQVGEWALKGTDSGFREASVGATRMADDLTTEIQP